MPADRRGTATPVPWLSRLVDMISSCGSFDMSAGGNGILKGESASGGSIERCASEGLRALGGDATSPGREIDHFNDVGASDPEAKFCTIGRYASVMAASPSEDAE